MPEFSIVVMAYMSGTAYAAWTAGFQLLDCTNRFGSI
jgi:hypothetical protein